MAHDVKTMHCKFSYLYKMYLCNHVQLYYVRFLVVCTIYVWNLTMIRIQYLQFKTPLVWCFAVLACPVVSYKAHIHILQWAFAFPVNQVCSERENWEWHRVYRMEFLFIQILPDSQRGVTAKSNLNNPQHQNQPVANSDHLRARGKRK